MSELLDATTLESTDGADGSILLPSSTDQVEPWRGRRPSDDEISDARKKLDMIFSGDNAKAEDARYRRGLQDFIYRRETPDASFYLFCEALSEVANYSYDK